MDEEIELLVQHMSSHEDVHKAGIHFRDGQLLGKSVVVCKSGVGKVNAAVCTQLLIDHFKVDAIIFTGVAGALNPELEIGDIVISNECQQHDMDVTALGFPKGTIPFSKLSIFPADPVLANMAYEAAFSRYNGRTIRGKVLSGDQFVASREIVKLLYEEMEGACTEMEGAAVAQVCAMNEIPYVIIRSMSDKADGSAHVNFKEFTKLASNRSYEIVEEMLRKMQG
jgi:adenosylhomocysteine nucleosidase